MGDNIGCLAERKGLKKGGNNNSYHSKKQSDEKGSTSNKFSISIKGNIPHIYRRLRSISAAIHGFFPSTTILSKAIYQSLQIYQTVFLSKKRISQGKKSEIFSKTG